MAIITQKSLFCWNDLQNIGDLKRLKYVLENLPDDKIINYLTAQRGKGRNDYPIIAIWNSILAGIVFQHESIESLRRELLRNDRLREICGFDPLLPAETVVPKPRNYTRFLKNLMKISHLIQEMFDLLVDQIKEVLPDFGNYLAHDGKAIQTFAKQKRNGYLSRDGRRDVDANVGIKEYKGVDKDGRLWKHTKTWFGYKLHLIIDANYELPVAFELTKATVAEPPKAHELIDYLEENHPQILNDAEYFTSDRGNDDGKLINKLWRKHQIKPIIDIRNLWKDPDGTRGLSNGANVIYNYKGDVFCVDPKHGDFKTMSYGGFEKDRNALKYRCPHQHCGVDCKGTDECSVYANKYVRISLKEDSRIFTPVARSSYKWKKLYKKRTAVERVNSRIDYVFGFEKHFIRGQKKMKIIFDIPAEPYEDQSRNDTVL